MWTDLLEIARNHWRQITADPESRTRTDKQEKAMREHDVYDTGTCMVAVLFIPSNSGAYFFVSTVPKHFQAEMRTNGYLNAPAWWAAVNRNSFVYCHAEDGAEYDFEIAFRSGQLNLPHIQLVKNGRTEYYDVQDRDLEYSRLKLAVWGCYGDDVKESREMQREGHFIKLCHNNPEKNPTCENVATTLNIEYCTGEKLHAERLARALSARYRKEATEGGQGGGRGGGGEPSSGYPPGGPPGPPGGGGGPSGGGGGPSSGYPPSGGPPGPSAGAHSSFPQGNTRSSASGGGSGSGYGSAPADSYYNRGSSYRVSRDPRGPDMSQLSARMMSLSVKGEPERREAPRREPERREATRREPERREAPRREPERREATRREPERREATRREPERREASRREPERREATRREPERREKPRREAAVSDSYWTWDKKRGEYYHVHSDGTVSVSRSGR